MVVVAMCGPSAICVPDVVAGGQRRLRSDVRSPDFPVPDLAGVWKDEGGVWTSGAGTNSLVPFRNHFACVLE